MVIPDVEYRLSVVSDGLRSASSELEDALFEDKYSRVLTESQRIDLHRILDLVRHLDDEVNDINNKTVHPEDEN